MLTNIEPPPGEGNFCENSNRTMKPYTVEQHNWHRGYVDISHHMANSYLMRWHTLKRNMKLFFHLLDLTVLNSLRGSSGDAWDVYGWCITEGRFCCPEGSSWLFPMAGWCLFIASLFGGLVVSMLASGTQVCGFKRGRSRWIFMGVKFLSMLSYGGEVKEFVPCPSFAACQRT